ncbi:hypothetical protein JCM11251_007330 [Rhodosporidiobolus azoricus]
MPVSPANARFDGQTAGEMRSDVDSVGGHAVYPEVVRETSTLESLATTLKAWAPFDPSATPLSPGSVASPKTDQGAVLADEDDGDEFIGGTSSAKEQGGQREGQRQEDFGDAGERVSWARWDEVEGEGGEKPRRILILGYKNGGVAIWDCSSLDTWVELLNLPTLDSAFDSKLRRKFPRGTGVTSSAAVLPLPVTSSASADAYAADRPLIAFCASSPSSVSSRSSASESSHVFLYSLRTHRIIDSFSVPGIAHRILSNRRHLVVSTTSPPALHIFRAADSSPLPFSPLTDVARSPFDGTPVFDLGAGGRLLAYATDRPLLSSRLDRAPARPGAGLLAHRDIFDTDHSSHSAAGTDVSSSSAAFAAEAAQAGGEVARRVGEGVMSGVKAIGEVGMSYWMSRGGRTSGSDGFEQGQGGGGLGAEGGKAFSRSAPQPSFAGFGRRTSVSGMTKLDNGSSPSALTSTAGTILVVDLLSPTPTTATKSPRARTISSSPSGVLSPFPVKIVAHLRPYSQPIALVSLSPSSTQVLTAPAAGHSFDVFELKPAVKVGVSATSSSPSSGTDAGRVWHRYRLSRGYTSAQSSAASWSPDGRFVAVSTSNAKRSGGGTAHVYAVNSTGGAPVLEKHFEAKVGNARELSPLSVGMAAVARVRASTHRAGKKEDEQAGVAPGLSRAAGEAGYGAPGVGSFPSVVFLPKADTIRSAFRPTPAVAGTAASASSNRPPFSPPLPPTSSSARAPTTFQDLITFHPSFGSATLHRLSLVEASPPPLATFATAAEGTLAAASRGDVRGVLSTTSTAAVSGLSQLMRRNGAAQPAPFMAGKDGKEPKKEWTVKTGVLAGWKLAREKGWGEVRERLFDGDEEAEDEKMSGKVMGLKKEKGTRKPTGIRYSAFAEIETFSRSPLVLPRSIYQSQQFDFYALPPAYAVSTKRGNFALLPLRKLEVRPEVRIRQGNDTLSSDPSTSPGFSARQSTTSPRLAPSSYSSTTSFEPASFDQPIKTAMQTFLEAEAILAPGSPKLIAPAYPNGVPGKHGSWRETMTRHVAPAALEGIGKVRQGLGRVKIPSVPALPTGMIALPLGARSKSASAVAGQTTSGTAGGVAYSSSLSFEDDDAVFAERVGFDAPASVGTAFTSEAEDDTKGGDGAGVAGLGAEDDEDWGWDNGIGVVEDDRLAANPASSSSGATPSSGTLETPFEEDFEDFEMELPGHSHVAGSGSAVKPLTLDQPSPFALDPIDDNLDSGKLASSGSMAIPVPSGLPKHLAPPVSLYPSPASSSSPTTGGTTVPTSLGSSSSSFSSGFDSAPTAAPGCSTPLLDRPGSALSGIGILAPSPSTALGLAAPTNRAGSASPALSSSPSGGSSAGRRKKKR